MRRRPSSALARASRTLLAIAALAARAAPSLADAALDRSAGADFSVEAASGVVDLSRVSRFGCDGAHPIDADLSRAEAALAARFGGGAIRLPAGRCVLARSYAVLHSNIHIIGAGRGATTLVPAARFEGDDLFAFGSTTHSLYEQLSLENLTLEPGEAFPGMAVHVNGTSDTRLRNVQIGAVATSTCGTIGIGVDNWGAQSHTYVENVSVLGCRGPAVVVAPNYQSPASNDPNEVFFTNVTTSKSGNDLVIYRSGGVYVSHWSSYKALGGSLEIVPPAAGAGGCNRKGGYGVACHAYGVKINMSVFDSSRGGPALRIGGGGMVGTIDLSNTLLTGAAAQGVDLPDDGTIVDGVGFHAVEISGSGLDGVALANVRARNIVFDATSRVCNNNVRDAPAGAGVAIGANVAGPGLRFDGIYGRCGWTGANLENRQRYGVSCAKGADHFSINATMTGNLTAPTNCPAGASRIVNSLP